MRRTRRQTLIGVVCISLIGLLSFAPASGAVASSYSWIKLAPRAHPTGLADVYLARLGSTIVLFGGTAGSPQRAQTWIWDGHAWTRHRSLVSPKPRRWAAMASDGQRIVLFGGNQFDGQPTPGVSYHIVADTWTFDGTTWSRYLGKQPPARQEAGMAADSAGLVMFGGDYVSNTRFEIFADTWLWRAGRWTQAPTAHAPSKRRGPLLGYDVASHRTVLFGGNDRVIYNDTWTWNGKDWRMARPTKQPDATSDGAPMVFNGAELIQFNSFAGTTWAWADGNWRQLTTAHSPGNRQSPGMAGDPAGGVVLFGGVDANGPAAHFNSDTWRLTR